MVRVRSAGTPSHFQLSDQGDSSVDSLQFGRESTSLTKLASTPALKNLKVKNSRGVAWSPSKRIVSFDKGAPTSARRPMREEFMIHNSPNTPTRPATIEDEWQDVDDGAGTRMPSSSSRVLARGPSSSRRRAYESETTDGETTDYSDLSNNSAILSYSPLQAKRTRDHTPVSSSSSRSRRRSSYLEFFLGNNNGNDPPENKTRGWGWHLDPGTPHVLASYLQLGFNLIMLSLLVYAAWMFVSTVRSDVNMKVDEYSMDILNEIDKCANEYLRNNCQPGKRVPALENMCNMWENCMNRDPKQVGRARVSAETFGEIVNSFLAPIGIKAMIFLVAVFSGSFVLVNAVFASRFAPARYEQNQPQQHYVAPPATPMTGPISIATPLASSNTSGYIVGYPSRHYTPRSSRKRR